MNFCKNFPLFFLAGMVLSIAITTRSPAWGDEGDKTYQKAVEYFNKGNKFSQQGAYKKAIVSFRKAIQVSRLLPAPHYNLANVLIATGEYEEAVKEYQEAIKINPMVPDYHRNLGFAYALLKKENLAKKKYEELKTLDSTQADILWQWIQQGKKQETSPAQEK